MFVYHDYIEYNTARPKSQSIIMSHLELQEFFVEGHEQRTSHVLLHITEPSTADELAKGYFFALIEINSATIGNIEKFQKMIDDIEKGYYETDHGDEKDPFEATLEFINRRSEQLLEEKIEVNALIGVIRNNTLAFAVHGNPHAYLFYRQKQEFGSVNILEGNDAQHTRELFPSVLQGNLNAGDFLFVGTPHVIEFIAPDRLQKLITSRSTKQSSEHIQKVLSDTNSEYSFGGIIFRILPHSEKIPPTFQQKANTPQGSEASLNKLMHAKQQTAETLSPPVFRQLLRRIKEKMGQEKQTNTTSTHTTRHSSAPSIAKQHQYDESTKHVPKHTGPEETISNALLIGFGRAIVIGLVGFGKTIKYIVLTLVKLLIGLFILITNKNNSRKEVVRSMQTKGRNLLDIFENLPVISKFLFVLTIFAVIIFSISLSTLHIRRQYVVKQETYKNIISAVQNKKDAAEASIIYDDNTTALTLLTEARDLLNQLPEKDKKADEQKSQFEQSIQESLRKVQKMKEVSPELITSLGSPGKQVGTEKLVRIDDTLIAYGPNDPLLYRVNVNTKAMEETNHETMTGLRIASTPKEQDTIVFIHADNRIATYQKDSGLLSPKTIGYPGTTTNIVDAFIYNVKLYTLDQSTNQIYKHSKTQTGYDKGTAWLKTTTDLSQAQSFAIDGDMFILNKDGNILKFTSGEQQTFTISGLEPALDEPSQLWTYNEVKNIYILEPKNKRVVVLDKTGKLVQQYTSSSWLKPTDMVIDETGKTAYILDDNKIYSFALEK